MSVSKLTYNGKDYDDEIVAEGGRIEMTHAMAGETLSADSLIVPITTGGQPIRFLAADQGENDFFLTADDKIFCASSGSGIPEYIKNSPGYFYFDNDLLVKQYLYQIKRRSMYEHEMIFYSAVWLLEQSDHVGGLYAGETVEAVLGEVLGSVVTYSIDDDIKGIQIYGYLPYDKRRNNLMKVLMAVSASLKNASDGALRITQLSDTVAGVFGESRVYIGGTVSDEPPATAIQVTEHNYLPSTEEVTLFDDTTLGTETVIFNEPYHDLAITGGTITDSGVNFCTFSATGAVVLTGQRYTHVTRIVTVGDAPTGTDTDTVRRVTDNTLLTPNNAVAVAEKLFDYLTKSQIIRQDVVVGTERPADVVSVVNPYTKELVDACIKSMSIQFGKNGLKATCEFLVGYKPSGATAGFEHYVLLTGSGSFRTTSTLLQYKQTEDAEWTTLIALSEIARPDGSIRIRAILVGAGDGGDGGTNGENSKNTQYMTGSAGGTGGAKGISGNIFEVNLAVSVGSLHSYVCGSGGVGGAAGASGNSGEDSTFGILSSATGRTYPYGYSEPKSGLTLCKDGVDGVNGTAGITRGVVGETVTFNGVTYYPGDNGLDYYVNGIGWAYGGCGGGAAVGGIAGDGGDGTYTYLYDSLMALHGDTGAGANAIAGADATSYGGGGNGGHGGGGAGGKLGTAFTPYDDLPGAAATGGTGGTGGKGGDGCIVIYY